MSCTRDLAREVMESMASEALSFLGLDAGASLGLIQAKYRETALKTHPGAPNTADDKAFSKAAWAYGVLAQSRYVDEESVSLQDALNTFIKVFFTDLLCGGKVKMLGTRTELDWGTGETMRSIHSSMRELRKGLIRSGSEGRDATNHSGDRVEGGDEGASISMEPLAEDESKRRKKEKKKRQKEKKKTTAAENHEKKGIQGSAMAFPTDSASDDERAHSNDNQPRGSTASSAAIEFDSAFICSLLRARGSFSSLSISQGRGINGSTSSSRHLSSTGGTGDETITAPAALGCSVNDSSLLESALNHMRRTDQSRPPRSVQSSSSRPSPTQSPSPRPASSFGAGDSDSGYGLPNFFEMTPIQKANLLGKDGNSHAKAGRYADAVRCFNEAMLLNPRDHRLWCNRAYCHFHRAEYMKCIEDAEKAMSMNSCWTQGYLWRGRALKMLERYVEAETDLTAFLLANPDKFDQVAAELHSCCQKYLQRKFGCSEDRARTITLRTTNIKEAESMFLSQLQASEDGFTPVTARERKPMAASTASASANAKTPDTVAASEALSVFIGGFPTSTSEKMLHDLFSAFGPIHSIRILPDKKSGFVNFKVTGCVESAIEQLNGSIFRGHHIVVKLQDRVKTSLVELAGGECILWRSTGCSNQFCRYKHVPENRGIDLPK